MTNTVPEGGTSGILSSGFMIQKKREELLLSGSAVLCECVTEFGLLLSQARVRTACQNKIHLLKSCRRASSHIAVSYLVFESKSRISANQTISARL